MAITVSTLVACAGYATPLHKAAGNGDLLAAKALLYDGADPNARNISDLIPPEEGRFMLRLVRRFTIQIQRL